MDKYITAAILSFFLVLGTSNLSYAAQGCCASHQGVAPGCPQSGQLMCNDGTSAISKNCACKPTKDSNEGCCSGHGGIDKKAPCKKGKHVCNDKTISPSCKC